MGAIRTINPSTGKIEKQFNPLSNQEIPDRLERADKAFQEYRQTDFSIRSQFLLSVAKILESRKEEFGRLITQEMGKTYRASIDEVLKCAWNFRYYAKYGPQFLAEEKVSAPPAAGLIRYEPLGVILAVMPWNFPFWQVFRFAAPALMAGNGVVLKHASNVPQCALQIEEIFQSAARDSKIPLDIFQTFLIGSGQVSALIEDSRIAAVTLTGSVEAGSSVAQAAGKSIKKTVMELGGSDPFIVMPSADLNRAAQVAVQARTINTGQSCVAAKRFIIAESIANEFEKKFIAAMSTLQVGDPMDSKTQIGPLATEEGLSHLEKQVRRTLDLGAELLLGGHRLDRAGFYYEPTVLAHIPKPSPAYQEEMFGPVASIFRAKDAYHAVSIANDTQFGLGSSVWTQDSKEQRLFSERIQAGNVFINQRLTSDPRLPFGGIKHSGYGRELGVFGIREFVNIKTISLFLEGAGDEKANKDHLE